MALVWEYDYITTIDGAILKTIDGKYVVLDARQVTGADGGGAGAIDNRRGLLRKIPREFYYEIVGIKLVPVIFNYDVIYQLVVELLVEMLGEKVSDTIVEAEVNGTITLLKSIVVDLLGRKVNGTYVENILEGKKVSENFITVGIESVKLHNVAEETPFFGEKVSPIETMKTLVGAKINLLELGKTLEGLKEQLVTSNVPITGSKIKSLVHEHIFKGQADASLLLYLLFDDEGLTNSNLLNKLTKDQLLILLDEEENED